MKFQSNRKWLFFLFLTILSLWFSGYVQREIRVFRDVSVRDYFDFNVYYTAALVARSDTDKNLYSYAEIADPENPASNVVVNPQLQPPVPDSTYGRAARQTKSDGQYLYPPFFALLVEPFTFLPFETAKIIWHVFIFLLACASVFLTVKLFYADYLTAAAIALAAVAVMEFTLPMQDLLFGGNVSSVILFLCAAGIYLHKKYPSAGAFFFAVAVAVKLTPIVVLPLMLVRRQWKWAIAFCGWSVLLLAISVWHLGWQNHAEFAARVLPAMSSGVPHLDNRSLSTAIYAVSAGKFFSNEEIRRGDYIFPEKTPVLLFKILTVVSFGGLLFFFWSKNKTDSGLTVEIMILLLWTLIFSPVSLRYGYLLAVAPVVFAWLHPLTKTASTARLATLSAATFMIFSILPSYVFFAVESFPVQLVLFLVMPVGVVLCMWYLMTLLKAENKTLAENL